MTLKTQFKTQNKATLDFAPHAGQAEIAEASLNYRYVVVRAGRRFGKALALDTPIMTTEGFKRLVDIKQGDYVFSELGKPVKVIGKSDVYTGRKCYKVQFSDGAEIIADASHDWVVEPKKYRKALGRAKNPVSKPEKLTTEQIANTHVITRKDGKHEYNYSIPTARPLQLERKELPIEPYFLGLWLGDGSKNKPDITTDDIEVAEYLEGYANRLGQTVKKKKNTRSNAYSYAVTGDRTQKSRDNSLRAKLRQLGVLNNKHIPQVYKTASYEQRLELLQGLMDSDGYCNGKGYAEFCGIYKELVFDFVEVLWSFGIKAAINDYDSRLYGKYCGRRYRVTFSTTDIPLFKLDRKLKNQKTAWKSDIKRRFIVGVEEIESRPVQCLTVDNPTHLFLAGKELIATHNSALALNIVLREAVHNPGRYWIIAPEYTQAKSIYWRDLVSEYVPQGIILKKNDNELILEIMSSVEGKTSVIEFKGSDREDKLRGAGLKGVVLDEYAFQKENVWDKVVGPMLVQTNGWAIFITTPNGVSNHFKKFWDDAVAAEAEPDNKLWKTFHFTSYDNPRIPRENLEAERARLTEEFFTQEYMAEFAKFTGLIYTGFDEKIHVQDFEIDEHWSFYRSIDFGATDPNAVSFIGVDKDGTNYIFDELYISDIYTSELAELIKQKSAHRYFVATYADSAAKQSIMDLGTYGIYAIPVKKNTETGNKNWIISGIDRVQQLLKDKKIVVHPRCKNTIKEFMSYSWRKDRAGDAVNIPEDRNNHILDEFRYYIMMYQGVEYQDEAKNYLHRGQVDPVVGY